MAIDGKYGHVQLEHSTIPDDEPVVVFRAQDKFLPKVLAYYYDLCELNGSPELHLKLIEKTWDTVLDWQQEHHTQVPQSAGLTSE